MGVTFTLIMEAEVGNLGSKLNVQDTETPPKILEELTVEGVVKHIKKLQASGNSEWSLY